MSKAPVKEYESVEVSPAKAPGDGRGHRRLNSTSQASSKPSKSPYKENYESAASAFSRQQHPRVLEYSADLASTDPSL